MGGRPWWVQMAASVAFVVLMSITLGWLDRARRRRAADDAALPYPFGAKVAALIFAPIFPLLAGFLLVYGLLGVDGDRSLLNIGIALGVGIPLSWLFVWWALESWLANFRLTPIGLVYRSPLGRTETVNWKDVTRVKLTNWHMFQIRTKKRQVVRISTSRRGLYLLAAAILEQVPREAIDPHTLEALAQTAAGSPPPFS